MLAGARHFGVLQFRRKILGPLCSAVSPWRSYERRLLETVNAPAGANSKFGWISDLVPDGTTRPRRLRRRLDPRCDGRPALQLRDPRAHLHVGHHARPGRIARYCGTNRLGIRGMVRRMVCRPHRPRPHSPDRDPVVCRFHIHFRTRAEFRPAFCRSRTIGAGLRRRMGGRRGSSREK